MLFFNPLGMGVLIVLHSVVNQPHTHSPHFSSFPTGLPDYLFKVLFFTAPPQYHEPSISSTISLPIYKFPFISPTSYRNPPMGPPPSTSSPSKLCPTWANHITLGHPFLYLYTHPKLFFIYCTNAFVSSIYITFLSSPLATFFPFLENATHVTLGWGTPYHLPLLTSSISSEYPTGHLPLPSEFVHFVPPLAQLIPRLVVPLTLDLVERLWPLILHIYPQPRAVLSLPYILTLTMYLLQFLTSPSRFHEALCFWESCPPFVDINTVFQKGDSILILITYPMRDLG
jgi:hypothetical protein